MNEFEYIPRSPCSMDQAVRVELLADVGISRNGLTSWCIGIRQIAWFRFLVGEIKGQSWKFKFVKIVKTRPMQYLWNYFRGNQSRLEISGDRFWLNSESKVICRSWNLPLWQNIPRKTNLLAKIVQKWTQIIFVNFDLFTQVFSCRTGFWAFINASIFYLSQSLSQTFQSSKFS